MAVPRQSTERISRSRIASRAIARGLLVLLLLGGCTVDNTKRHYVLAEKLWTDGKYAASVNEFEKVASRDPRGKLGTQALLRAATTQALFLQQYPQAVQKLKRFTELSQNAKEIWEVREQIGDILYNKMQLYNQAARYYRELMQLRANSSNTPTFLFRIGRSDYFLGRFDDAIASYQHLVQSYPSNPLAERAAFEIAQTRLAQGEQADGTSKKGQALLKIAMTSFQGFLQAFPHSKYESQAQFGIASCLEDMNQLDAAFHAYQLLLDTYPSRKVIEIKLERIRERKAQRSR